MFFVNYLPEFLYQPLKLSIVRPIDFTNSKHALQLFALTERHVNEGLDYGTLFEIPGFKIVNEPKHNGCCGGEGSEYTYKIT